MERESVCVYVCAKEERVRVRKRERKGEIEGEREKVEGGNFQL